MFIGPVNRSSSRAFTLLEVTLSVAILGMMALIIYRFVQANIMAVRISAEATIADARYSGLRELLMVEWQSLPSGQGAMTGEPAKLNDRPRDEIRWICGPGPGLLTRYAPGDFSVWLRLKPPAKNSNQMDLGILRRPKADPGLVHEHDTWVPLIENVKSLQIRYFDPRLNIWVDRWTDTLLLPRLVKLIVGRPDANVPWEIIIPLGRTPY
ncbi:MAG: prepilin-type N-terminal cleavage/methylation domain-containing protein [Verrucomicrobiota bacterium]